MFEDLKKARQEWAEKNLQSILLNPTGKRDLYFWFLDQLPFGDTREFYFFQANKVF